MKILVTIGLLIGLLAVCYLPFLIMNIINVFAKQLKVTLGTVIAFKFIHFLNSAINPVVYALRNRDLGRAIKTMLCGKQQRDVTLTAQTLASGNPSRSVVITTTWCVCKIQWSQNNYSPKLRGIVVDITFTDTDVNNCFSIKASVKLK